MLQYCTICNKNAFKCAQNNHTGTAPCSSRLQCHRSKSCFKDLREYFLNCSLFLNVATSPWAIPISLLSSDSIAKYNAKGSNLLEG